MPLHSDTARSLTTTLCKSAMKTTDVVIFHLIKKWCKRVDTSHMTRVTDLALNAACALRRVAMALARTTVSAWGAVAEPCAMTIRLVGRCIARLRSMAPRAPVVATASGADQLSLSMPGRPADTPRSPAAGLQDAQTEPQRMKARETLSPTPKPRHSGGPRTPRPSGGRSWTWSFLSWMGGAGGRGRGGEGRGQASTK